MYGSIPGVERTAVEGTGCSISRFFQPFRLYTDASNVGLGAILAQKQEGKERIICCANRTNLYATKKECLAVVWGIKNFRNYLIANHFKVYTDHYSLQWLRSMKSESALLHRWVAQLEDYDFEILHRPGKNQGHVDALSKLPMDMVHFLGKDRMVLTSAEDTVQVLERIHKDGHLGVKKTLKFFRRRFEGIRKKALCQAVVSSCEGCQLGSDYKPLTLPQGKIESTSPWDVVSIDIMGPFVSGRKGERYILSVIDCFSRYLVLIPIKDHNATTVSQALFERVIGYFGCLKKILSDKGTEFTGRVWAEMMELMGIKQLLTSPYYPQGNGIVEKSHRTIGNMIRAQLVNRDDRDWVDVLPGIMLLFNEMEQGNHGYSASQIMWGQGMNLPTDLIYTPREFGRRGQK